jgi:BirA family biotin operon repressor/biotin-[acetyl-CoA-carboxylase] ligase
VTAFPARQERFEQVASTNDVVRGWLAAGTPEVCLAVADEQTAGRGRAGRSWTAPSGAALLLSVGFRPTWLAPGHAWRLAAVVSLAMADAAEHVAGLRDRAIRLKWPNDLVIEEDDLPLDAGAGSRGGEASAGTGAEPGAGSGAAADPGAIGAAIRKLGGVLGESEGIGTADPRVVVGIGLNAGWARADFPADLAPAMTSLHDATGGRPIDRALLLDAFLARLEPRLEALRGGRFAVDDWTARQLTTGRLVHLEDHGGAPEEVLALGLDPATGALLVADPTAPGEERAIHAGDVVRVRLAAHRRPAAITPEADGPSAAGTPQSDGAAAPAGV